jgi:hypothetical protein
MTLFVGASESYDTDAWEAYSLKKENTRLRELVRGLYHELDAATQYDAGGSRGVVSEFADRMRELGIKVK